MTTLYFTEIGLDFDNNKFGFGISSEIENSDGVEIRKKGFVKMKPDGVYFRLWVLKYTLILSSKNIISLKRKDRNNFKIVFGISGK